MIEIYLAIFKGDFWRRKWQATPVFLPGESNGQRSMVGYSPWGHKESDTTGMTKQQQLDVYCPLVPINTLCWGRED